VVLRCRDGMGRGWGIWNRVWLVMGTGGVVACLFPGSFVLH
jgi:hypothetical protein